MAIARRRSAKSAMPSRSHRMIHWPIFSRWGWRCRTCWRATMRPRCGSDSARSRLEQQLLLDLIRPTWPHSAISAISKRRRIPALYCWPWNQGFTIEAALRRSPITDRAGRVLYAEGLGWRIHLHACVPHSRRLCPAPCRRPSSRDRSASVRPLV